MSKEKPKKQKKAKQKLVKPVTLKGFQDHLPADVLKRRAVMRTIETVFERYGFVPLESPALEHADVLLGAGGTEVNKELFQLESPEAEPIALRFDLTVPFARMIAQYPEQLKPPFRRYAIGPVWRADKPGPGRFRQFTQMDVDVAGPPSIIADAEIIAVCIAPAEGEAVVSYANQELRESVTVREPVATLNTNGTGTLRDGGPDGAVRTRYYGADFAIDADNLALLAESCGEFLIHATDVEGKQQGVDEELIALLGDIVPIPTTYAGGVRSRADIDTIAQLGQNKLDFTVGSALDIFGGTGLRYEDMAAVNGTH